MDVEPALVRTDSELGERYLAAMELAGSYAYAGAKWVVDKVRSSSRREQYRCSSQPSQLRLACRSMRGEICGSCARAPPGVPRAARLRRRLDGRRRVILEGIDGEKIARGALQHDPRRGPGDVAHRVRAAAFSAIPRPARRSACRAASATTRCWRGCGKRRAAHRRRLDEAPQAYRRLPDVLAEHEGTVRVLHTLRPFAVIMAGEKEFDPYKD